MINWGIIGCGDVTEKKSGPAFNKVEGSRLAAVMRRNPEKAADYARRHKVDKWYSDAGEMMNSADINAVYIATPPAWHLPYALEAIKRGLNVYIEKPATLNAGEARQIAGALKNSGSKLVVAHYRRAVPMFLYVKQLLDKKAVGDVRTVQIRMWQQARPQLIAKVEENWRVDPALAGGGYFHDLAPHQLDLMLYYFGSPLQAGGYGLNQSGIYAADDHVSGQLLFNNKIVANGSWCFNVPEREAIDECVIIGSEGRIAFPFFGNTVSWYNGHEEQMVSFEHPQHIQQPMIEKTVRYFEGKELNPCTIDDAVIVMEMIDTLSATYKFS